MLYAQPYDHTANGFYFSSYEEYLELAAKSRVEEFEIQLIEGDNAALFYAAGINQSNLEIWFDELAHIAQDSDKGLALRYLLAHLGKSLEEALEQADDVNIYRGKLSDYAREIAEDAHGLSGFALMYFDADAYARDMEINGEVAEIEYEVYCTNAQAL